MGKIIGVGGGAEGGKVTLGERELKKVGVGLKNPDC